MIHEGVTVHISIKIRPIDKPCGVGGQPAACGGVVIPSVKKDKTALFIQAVVDRVITAPEKGETPQSVIAMKEFHSVWFTERCETSCCIIVVECLPLIGGFCCFDQPFQAIFRPIFPIGQNLSDSILSLIDTMGLAGFVAQSIVA